MSVPSPAVIEAMQRASALLQARNFVAARDLLAHVLQATPDFAEAHRLHAGALLALGDGAGAERSLRQAVASDPGWAPAQAALGELLVDTSRYAEAEQALRRALAGNRPFARAALLLASLLNQQHRFADTLLSTAAFADDARADPNLLHQYGVALNKLERHEEAAKVYRRVVAALPGNANAEFHLAVTLEAAGRHREAEKIARSAIGRGAGSPEARYLHASTLIATDRSEEAEPLLRELVRERPNFGDAQLNLAQILWMRSGDAAVATSELDAALLALPGDAVLLSTRAGVLATTMGDEAAYQSLAEHVERENAPFPLLLAASHHSLRTDATLALSLADRALRTAPGNQGAHRARIEALLGVGDAGEALREVETLLVGAPDDQQLIAAQTTAWRLLGDPRYGELCDYARLARPWTIATPPGWSCLTDYLRDLAASLERLHVLPRHPLHQSLRNGSQTAQNLLDVEDAPIRAFFGAIDEPIRRHIEAIGHGDDPLRRRNSGGYKVAGIWSVRLRAQGYHTNHVHPKGWLSSACYIELPGAVTGDNPDRQGFLKFGEPGHPTQPELQPEYFIRPEPGLLALFPSYFWHGTVPFRGDDTRLTIAFDLVPA
ncbi:MAG: tetratricopeptide repeat protein [Proteobacteria bacterium]|uniref:tetratricopeptide repeat protein n=1 Tax=Rudaea sp. TaxID=2136325 RepID=UPI00322069E2|nr:tetratricopeptide repeat protein [Pseudomonadota bacterium]